VLSPLVGAVLIMLLPRGRDGAVHRFALVWSLVTLLLTIVALVMFDRANTGDDRYVLMQHLAWVTGADSETSDIDISYRVGVDAIGMWLMALTSFLTPLAIWSSFSSIRARVREYYVLMLLLQVGMLGVFCSLDLLLFYVFFEFTLVPLFFLIGIWGGPERRRAAFKFFLFTLAGSVLTFAGIVYLAYTAWAVTGQLTLNIESLTSLGQSGALSFDVQWWLFVAFAAGFAIKVPLFPVHTWLPLAHTEAPTAGSVILAGVLLKLGTYGFCRLSIPMLPDATIALAPFVAVLAIIGIIYAALAAWVQEDVKKLVAYSSVSHLGFCMLGLFSLKIAGVSGAVFYMINHGLSTGALFLVVGCMYERYHTRSIFHVKQHRASRSQRFCWRVSGAVGNGEIRGGGGRRSGGSSWVRLRHPGGYGNHPWRCLHAVDVSASAVWSTERASQHPGSFERANQGPYTPRNRHVGSDRACLHTSGCVSQTVADFSRAGGCREYPAVADCTSCVPIRRTGCGGSCRV